VIDRLLGVLTSALAGTLAVMRRLSSLNGVMVFFC
jgi:hypothetical protein